LKVNSHGFYGTGTYSSNEGKVGNKKWEQNCV